MSSNESSEDLLLDWKLLELAKSRGFLMESGVNLMARLASAATKFNKLASAYNVLLHNALNK